MEQGIFVEDGLMFGGRYEARLVDCWDDPHWQVRLLPDRPQGKAKIVAQRGTRQEAFDKLWELIYG